MNLREPVTIVPITGDNIDFFKIILFDPRGEVRGKRMTFGFIDGNTPAGTAVVDDDGDLLSIESLYILPEFRRQGIAGAFLSFLYDLGRDGGRLFLTSEFADRQEDLKAFFLNAGFLLTAVADTYCFYQRNAVKNEKAFKHVSRPYEGRCVPVQSLSAAETNEFVTFLSDFGYSAAVLKQPDFSKVLSCCSFDKANNLMSFMLCFVCGDDIVVEMLAGKQNFCTILTFRHLLTELRKRDEKGKIPENGRVIFQGEKDSVIRSLEELLGGNLESIGFFIHAVREL